MKTKERKTGEIFNIGKYANYVALKNNFGCSKDCCFCYSNYGGCESPEIIGPCQKFNRKDNCDIVFRNIIEHNKWIGMSLEKIDLKFLNWNNTNIVNNKKLKNDIIFVPLFNGLTDLAGFLKLSKSLISVNGLMEYQKTELKNFIELLNKMRSKE